MSRGIADTSLFIARESGRPTLEGGLPEELAVSVMTVGEPRAGVLSAQDTATRERRLATLAAVPALDPLPVTQPVADAWARLRVELREADRRMPVNDSWIAATAIHLGVPVVTQDNDYEGVPGLQVIQV